MLSAAQKKKLKRLIANYAEWREIHSWRHGGDPTDIEAKEYYYNKAKKALYDYIKDIPDCT